MKKTLIVVAKWPMAGDVKTRLSPPLTLDLAADLYECFLLDSFDQYKHLEDVDVIVSFFPPEARDTFKSLIPKEFHLLQQQGYDLAEKLVHAFEYCFSLGYDLGVIIGSDHPTLPLEIIEESYSLLEKPENDVVIGPCLDGGFYTLGLKLLDNRIFQNINWSTNTVFSETLENIKELNLNVARLPPWYDIDDAIGLRLLCNELQKPRDEKLFKPRRTTEFLLNPQIKALLEE